MPTINIFSLKSSTLIKATFCSLVFTFFTVTSSLGQVTQPSYYTLLQSEEFLSNEGRYIVPNEFDYYKLASSYKGKKGVLISVGTFRSLVAASIGEFDEVILMDADKQVVEFNRRQIEILKISPTIFDFYINLLGIQNNKREINKFKKALSVSTHAVSDYLFSDSVNLGIKHYLLQIIKLSSQEPNLSFITNHNSFLKLKTLALNQKIYSVGGDLAGETTLPKISKYLISKGLEVSVLDVSNAPDYIMYSKMMGSFIKNLKLLPFTKEGVINFTVLFDALSLPQRIKYSSISRMSRSILWTYYSTKYSNYISEAKSLINVYSPFDKDGKYIEFIDNVSNRSKDLNFIALCNNAFSI